MIALLAAVLSAPVPAPPPADAPGHVVGRVVDAAGKPVAGADVYFWEYGSKKATAKSGADGRFRLGPTPPTAFPVRLHVDATGFARLHAPCPAILPGTDGDAGDLAVLPGLVLSGRVTDDRGNPLPGAAVTCAVERYTANATVSDVGPPYELTAGAGGVYATPPLPAGKASVAATAAGREKGYASAVIDPTAPPTVPVIKLKADVPYTGRVVDGDGSPVAGAAINGYAGLDAKTDADGRFEIRGHGRPRAAFSLYASKDGYTPAYFEMTDENPTVTLRKAGAFAGTVADADTGGPVKLSRVWLTKVGGKRAYARFRQPVPGEFRVEFPDPGEYTIRFEAAGYDAADLSPAKADKVTTVEGLAVRLKRWKAQPGPDQSIVGAAALDGQPVPIGWAALYRLSPFQGYQSSQVARGRAVGTNRRAYVSAQAAVRQGRFELPVPDAGDDWYVVIHTPGGRAAVVGPFAVKARETKRLEIAIPASGSVAGRVAVPPAWAGHVWVVAFAANGFRAEARVGADGRYRFDTLPPGEYGLKAGHDSFADQEVAAERETNVLADPWKRAVRAAVAGGKVTSPTDLDLPEK